MKQRQPLATVGITDVCSALFLSSVSIGNEAFNSDERSARSPVIKTNKIEASFLKRDARRNGKGEGRRKFGQTARDERKCGRDGMRGRVTAVSRKRGRRDRKFVKKT